MTTTPRDVDTDTLQYGTDPPFHYWEHDHTALVHVLWHAKHTGLTLDDADGIASLIMQSRWRQATLAEGAKRELTAATQDALDAGRRLRPTALGDWLLARKDRLTTRARRH